MITLGNAGSAGPLFVAGIGFAGLILSPLAELLIARLLPRTGGLPPLPIRIVTALGTGAACAAFTVKFGVDPVLPAFLLLAVAGAQLARIDISLHLLPNPIVIALLIAGLFLFLAPVFTGSPIAAFLRGLAGGGILFAIYMVLAVISPGSIGMGDVKLAAPLGLYLGYLGWTQLMYGGLLGFLLNGMATAVIVARNRRKRPAEVAHGPSMIAAAAAVALFMR
ncbi:MAG: peptidase [Pseudarthrobacter sp.]|nr:peptidase [Pseudarthrobacter sp.]